MSNHVSKKCLIYVKWYADRGISNFTLSMDYRWLTNKYIPALIQGEKIATSKRDVCILSDGYYLLGDIYDFMNAPTMAIKAYRRSIKFDPSNAGSHRELGNFLFNTGQIDKGISHLRKAVKLWPEDNDAALDLKWALEDRRSGEKPLYTEDELAWQIMDLILSGNGDEALENLRSKRGIAIHQLRTYAYGSLGLEKEYIKEWEKIEKLKSPVEFEHSDWFFITDNLWMKSIIWDIWMKMDGRFMPGIFPQINCFNEYFKIPKKTNNKNTLYGATDYYTPAFLKVINRRYCFYFKVQAAMVHRDIDTLKILYKKYPKCKELKSFIKSGL